MRLAGRGRGGAGRFGALVGVCDLCMMGTDDATSDDVTVIDSVLSEKWIKQWEEY